MDRELLKRQGINYHERGSVIGVATRLVADRYPEAGCAFAAGSLVRGDGSKYSDIDLVVVFDRLEAAYRESFYYENYPVEAFVHDAETLAYFFSEVDRPSGVPSLPRMVAEGLFLSGDSELASKLKAQAGEILDAGPVPLTEEQLAQFRYWITDRVDDLRDSRSYGEMLATGSDIYPMLADFYLRSGNRWSAKGKAIPRELEATSPQYAARFQAAFEELLKHGDPGSVIELAEETLAPFGGLLFADYKLVAPESWRKPGDDTLR